MATTYLDYAIKYGSDTKSTNTNTGLTSIAVKYGSDTKATITTTGTKTLATSGKYCNKDITIGAKSLATSGKYCDKNISIVTTAHYRWQRYNVSIGYSYNTTSSVLLIAGSDYSWTTRIANPACGGCYIASGWTFDSSTGKFSLTSPTWKALDYGDYTQSLDKVDGSYVYILGNANATSGTTLYGWSYVVGSQAGSGYADWRYYNLQGLSTQHSGAGSDRWNWNVYTSYSYQYRGSYIDLVDSTSSSAYPTDGISGSYWYVAV